MAEFEKRRQPGKMCVFAYMNRILVGGPFLLFYRPNSLRLRDLNDPPIAEDFSTSSGPFVDTSPLATASFYRVIKISAE